MIQYITPDQLPKLTLEIAKPNRDIVGRLKEAIGKSQRLKLGQINEIDFRIPYKIDRNFQLIDNPNVDKLKSGYHIRATFGEQEEWYIVSNLNTSFDSNGIEFLQVQLKSLGYQLKDKKIRTWAGVLINGEFRKESLNAQQVLDNLLSVSSWSVEYIDSEFLTKSRAFDFSNVSVLDAIFQVAETFGAIIQWNTINKSISLLKQENIGINKGLRVSERKYLKTLTKEVKSDEIVTRLKVYGNDGLSINRINPLGTDYLEDFSYYMHGFERDSNKSVISSSPYMSDGLCNALLDYQVVIDNNKSQFDSLVSQKGSLQTQYTTLQNDIDNLNMQLIQVQDIIDTRQTQGLDATAELQQEADLKAQIQQKQTEQDNVVAQINDIDSQIATLKNTLAIENNLTSAHIIELDNFIHEEVWEDQNYTDDEELFTDSQKVFSELNKPKEIITTNIINLFKLQEGKQDWKKVILGDKFFINYERFGIDVETQLIELDIDHEGTDINITIANTKDIERDEDKLSKILYQSVSTASTVNMSKYKWDSVNNVKTTVDEIISGIWDSGKREITAGVNETVTINNRGITITDSTDPLRFVRMTNSVIGLTQDGGNTFKTAISPKGVAAELLIGKIVMTENLIIENSSGSYKFDQNGFTINGGAFTMIDDGNGISINPTTGITSTSTNVKATFNATDGLKFQTKVGSNWIDRFYYDVYNNRLVLNGEGNFTELKVSGQSVLTSDKLKINGGYIDKITTDQLIAGYAKIKSALIDSITAEQINGGTITGVTVNVDTEMWVGNTINLGGGIYNSSTAKYIKINGSDTWIGTYGSGIEISTSGNIHLDSSYSITFGAGSTVDLSSAGKILWGSNAPNNVAYASNAGNADTVDGYHASSFSLSGHSHGSAYIRPWTGQNLYLWRSADGSEVRVYDGSGSYTSLRSS